MGLVEGGMMRWMSKLRWKLGLVSYGESCLWPFDKESRLFGPGLHVPQCLRYKLKESGGRNLLWVVSQA